MTVSPVRDRRAAFLATPALASSLARYVRGRVPPAEVDDIVQSTLADALASGSPPENEAELQPWVFGIARNKVADFFRRNRREVPQDPQSHDEVAAAESAPQTAKDLLRWAERELPEGDGAESTLEWMLREGAGEKLETIAAEENVPAPRVRQRVARMRKHFRARWAAQLAAVAALVAIAVAIWAMWKRRANDIAVPEPLPAPTQSNAPLPEPMQEKTPEMRAAEMRRDAFDACDRMQWRECLDRLDDAKRLDPAGDTEPRVQNARKLASDMLQPPMPTKDPIDSKGKVWTPPVTSPSTTTPSKPAPPAPKSDPTSPTITPPAATGAPTTPNLDPAPSPKAAPKPATGPKPGTTKGAGFGTDSK